MLSLCDQTCQGGIITVLPYLSILAYFLGKCTFSLMVDILVNIHSFMVDILGKYYILSWWISWVNIHSFWPLCCQTWRWGRGLCAVKPGSEDLAFMLSDLVVRKLIFCSICSYRCCLYAIKPAKEESLLCYHIWASWRISWVNVHSLVVDILGKCTFSHGGYLG